MKKDGKYRYTLQFDDKPKENQIVGDFLERLGNRKSPVIIEALMHYLDTHPDANMGQTKIKVQVNSSPSWDEIEKKIYSIIEKAKSDLKSGNNFEDNNPTSISDTEIESMLNNLDIFN